MIRNYVGLIVLGVVGCATQLPGGEHDPLRSSQEALESGLMGGAGLPAKTLVLSYDDGPGDRSLELSTYLRGQGIRATFFVTGWQVDARPGVIAQLAADGHRIANHTQTHTNMTTQTAAQVRAEVQSVDTLIAPLNPDGHLFFRPPYFAWSAGVQAAFAGTALDRYVGPIHADIGNQMAGTYAADWACWQEAHISSAACADLYMNEIRARDHGIVLLHDPWGDAFGNTVDMTKNLVPRLKAEGYRFATLEEVPAIAAYFPAPAVDAGAPVADAAGSADASSGIDAAVAVDAASHEHDAAAPQADAGSLAVQEDASAVGTPDAGAKLPVAVSDSLVRCSVDPSSPTHFSWLAGLGAMLITAASRRRRAA